MNIAVNVRFLLPDNQLEGIGRFTYETLRRMVASHPEHTFHFLFDRAYDPRYVFGPNVVPHVLFPPARHPFLFVAWFEGAIGAWLRRRRPDVLLSPDGFTTLATSVPRVTVIHDLAMEHFPLHASFLQRRYYQFFGPRFARASRRLLTVSEATRQDVIKTYGIEPERIKVIYNAADAHFRPLPEEVRPAVREQYSGGLPYFLFVGALHPRKNLVNLLKAFDAFKAQTGSTTQLLVVGRKAWNAGALLDAYQGMRHQADVRFTGRVADEELVRLYGAARACAYVPLLEGFGIPIVEAQQSGCPVLTSDRSSMPEVAGTGGALLANPFSVEELAAALVRLDTDAELRAGLVLRGLKNVNRFSWDESAARLWEAVEQTATGKSR